MRGNARATRGVAGVRANEPLATVEPLPDHAAGLGEEESVRSGRRLDPDDLITVRGQASGGPRTGPK